MNTAIMILQQVAVMFLLAGIGAIAFKSGKISLEGSKCLGNILLYLSLPAVIINGFLVERTSMRISGLLISAVLAAVSLAISMLVARVLFKKDPIAQFASAFSNPGFFGIPIITSCIGNGAVFYIAAYIAFLNLLQWTYGVSLLKGEKTRFHLRQLLHAPFFIAIIAGAAVFFSGITLPSILTKTISLIAGLNTPLAMFTVGVYLAQTDLKQSISKYSLYVVSAAKLLITPVLLLLLLTPLPASFYELKFALLIAAACPTGSNIAVYAQLHNRDYTYAVETVIITTLFSMITLPLITHLTTILW